MISYESPDPEFGKELVDYAVDLLDKRFATIGQNRNIAKHDQLESKLADVQAQMTVLEDDIQKFQQKYGVISVDSIAKEQISTEAQMRSELIMKEMEIKTYGDVSKVQDPALMRLEAERDNLSKLLDQLEKGFTTYEKVLPSQRELPGSRHRVQPHAARPSHPAENLRDPDPAERAHQAPDSRSRSHHPSTRAGGGPRHEVRSQPREDRDRRYLRGLFPLHPGSFCPGGMEKPQI